MKKYLFACLICLACIGNASAINRTFCATKFPKFENLRTMFDVNPPWGTRCDVISQGPRKFCMLTFIQDKKSDGKAIYTVRVYIDQNSKVLEQFDTEQEALNAISSNKYAGAFQNCLDKP